MQVEKRIDLEENIDPLNLVWTKTIEINDTVTNLDLEFFIDLSLVFETNNNNNNFGETNSDFGLYFWTIIEFIKEISIYDEFNTFEYEYNQEAQMIPLVERLLHNKNINFDYNLRNELVRCVDPLYDDNIDPEEILGTFKYDFFLSDFLPELRDTFKDYQYKKVTYKIQFHNLEEYYGLFYGVENNIAAKIYSVVDANIEITPSIAKLEVLEEENQWRIENPELKCPYTIECVRPIESSNLEEKYIFNDYIKENALKLFFIYDVIPTLAEIIGGNFEIENMNNEYHPSFLNSFETLNKFVLRANEYKLLNFYRQDEIEKYLFDEGEESGIELTNNTLNKRNIYFDIDLTHLRGQLEFIDLEFDNFLNIERLYLFVICENTFKQ